MLLFATTLLLLFDEGGLLLLLLMLTGGGWLSLWGVLNLGGITWTGAGAGFDGAFWSWGVGNGGASKTGGFL